MNYRFRAWDTELSSMLEHQQVLNTQAYKGDNPRNLYDVFNDPTLTIMCSLGVEDSQGVEVFEGDILKVDAYKHVLYEVFRDKISGSFFCEPFCKGSRYKTLPGDIPNVCSLWDELKPQGPVVIGNVYQNKNLLNKFIID